MMKTRNSERSKITSQADRKGIFHEKTKTLRPPLRSDDAGFFLPCLCGKNNIGGASG